MSRAWPDWLPVEWARALCLPTGDWLVTVLVIVLAAGLLGSLVRSLLRLVRAVRAGLRVWRLPTTRTGSLPLRGQVEVTGRVGGEAVQSPITDTACVFWRVEVEEDQGRRGWVTVLERQSEGEFTVDDGSGRVRVEPAGTRLDLRVDSSQAEGLFEELTPWTRGALERLGVQTEGWLGGARRLRVRERYLAPGDRVVVLGQVQRAAGHRILASAPGAPLLLTDRSEGQLLGRLALGAAGSATAILGNLVLVAVQVALIVAPLYLFLRRC